VSDSGDLRSYLPPSLLRWLGELPHPLPGAEARTFEGVLMIADVVGFTSTTERYGSEGPSGVEGLTDALNKSFGRLTAEIHAHGGEVLFFAGDAIVALWSSGGGESLAELTQRSTVCGLSMIGHVSRSIPGSRAKDADRDEGTFELRVGIAAGSLHALLLGGVADRWHYMVIGPTVMSAGLAAAAGAPGSLTLESNARNLIADRCVTSSTQDGFWQVDHADPPPSLPQNPPSPIAEAVVRAFAPREIVAHLERDHSQWLAEFRRVTVCFVGLRGIDAEKSQSLQPVQSATRCVQEAIARYEGAFYQAACDDKGITLIVAWGMPSATHANDAVRALRASLDIHQALQARGIGCEIGVATGRAFCGHRGTETRQEYAMLGNVMNLAARLMSSKTVGVVCDRETARAAEGRIDMEPLEPLSLKGKAEPVSVYRARAEIAATRASGQAIVGRENEKQRLEAQLEAIGNGRPSAVVLIEGEPGIGKSRLLEFVRRAAEERQLACFSGDADAIERSTSFYIWREILADLLDARELDGSDLIERVKERLREAGLDEASAPLLNGILPLDLEETAAMAEQDARVRADALRDLVVQLFRHRAEKESLVVVLDDAHWFDSASWALVEAIATRVDSLLLVIGSRPFAAPPPEWERLCTRAGDDRIVLEGMSSAEVEALSARRLGVSELPPPATSFIADRSRGNPFFGEQLCLALYEAGHLRVEGGRCRLAAHVTDLDSLGVPDSVEGVIVERVDRLSPGQQITLKVASAIGRIFLVRLLEAVHPDLESPAQLREQLETFDALDLTLLENPDPSLAYLFKHIITQQVVYGLMAYAQRRELHRGVALWYEAAYANDLSPYLSTLAHHWSQTGDHLKALDYLERAAEQAFASHANEEVVRFMTEALEILERENVDIPAERQSVWEWRLGEALHKLSRYVDARKHYEASLALLGLGVPRTTRGLWLELGRELAVQGLHRIAPGWFIGRQVRRAMRLRQAAHIHQRLAEVGYWEHDFATLLHSTVASLNQAERTGESKELQLAYQVMGFTFGLARLSSWFRFYTERSRRVAEHVSHTDTVAFSRELEAIYHNSNGNWEEIEAAGRTGSELFESLGDRFRWQTCIILRAYGLLHRGQLGESKELFERAYQMVGTEGAVQAQVWSVAGLLAIELARKGRVDANSILDLELLLARGVDHSDAIMSHGLLARSYWAQGDRDDALSHAKEASVRIARFPPASFHTLLGNGYVCELYLDLWEIEGKTRWKRQADLALTGLRAFARLCPIGRPRIWTMRARRARLAGRPATALRCARRAVAEAQTLHMDLEEALAHRELVMQLSEKEAGPHLQRLIMLRSTTTAEALLSAPSRPEASFTTTGSATERSDSGTH